MNLNHNLSSGHRVMVHAWIEISKTARRESHQPAFVKSVAHANFEIAENYCDVFPVRVPMRRNFVAARHLQTHCEIACRCCRVTFNDCQLRTCGQRVWCRSIRNLVRHKCILRW